MVAVVYHLTGHAAVNTDVLASDEACLVGTEIEHHVCNIQRIAHTPDWLLHGIGTLVNGIGGVNPTRRNAVHTYLARQTNSKSMGQCGNATLCSRITLCLGWLIRSREDEMFTMAAPLAKYGAKSLAR